MLNIVLNYEYSTVNFHVYQYTNNDDGTIIKFWLPHFKGNAPLPNSIDIHAEFKHLVSVKTTKTT